MVSTEAKRRSAPVTLRELTRHNIKAVLAMRVTEEQRRTVYPRSNGYSIAEGHYPQDDDPVWMRAIFAGEAPVGFLMTSEAPDRGEYFLWRLMVDAEHQGRGHGKCAVELLIDRILATPNAKVLLTSHIKGDGDAGGFYRRLGFEYTGEIIDGYDHVMRLDLSGREGQA